MSWMHNSSVRGHYGILKTYQRTKRLFYWPNLKEKVVTHVKHYDICQMNKSEHNPPPGLLDPISVPAIILYGSNLLNQVYLR
jgi:Integrase zinc binding domain